MQASSLLQKEKSIQKVHLQIAEGLGRKVRIFPSLQILGVGALFFLVRGLLAAFVPVSGDEAYYWLWGKHLSLGYHDHPPLVGWLIGLSTLVWNSAFWVRFPAFLCSLLASIFIFSFSFDLWKDLKKAEIAFLFYLFMPILAISSMAVFPDSPLVLAWTVCLWAGWKSLHDGRYWRVTGLAIGIALLSKLMGFFLFVSWIFFFLVSKPSRSWFKDKFFWQGIGLCFLISLPFWIWNFQHHFENVMFQAEDHLKVNPENPIFSMLHYLGISSLNVSPILFIFLIFTLCLLVQKSFRGDLRSQYLLAFALPVHLFFLGMSAWTKVGFHWSVPGYLSLLVAAAGLSSFKSWLRISLISCVGFTLLFYAIIGFPRTTAKVVVPLENQYPLWGIREFLAGRGYGEILGYASLARELEKIPESNFFFLTDSYTLSSDLWYYVKKPTYTLPLTGQGGEFFRWNHFEKLKGRSALWVDFNPLTETYDVKLRLQGAFQQTGITREIKVVDGPVVRKFYVTPCYRLINPTMLFPDFEKFFLEGLKPLEYQG